jgi:CYTH domain-containing protein
MGAQKKKVSDKNNLEMERKFYPMPKVLFAAIGGLARHPHSEINQGYFLKGGRLRREDFGDHVEYTNGHKDKKNLKEFDKCKALVRNECDPLISREEFQSSWLEIDGGRLKKSRFRIPYTAQPVKNEVIEIDIFKGQKFEYVRKGSAEEERLIIIEVEFKSITDADKFKPPKWFGIEVTHDPRFTSKYLAMYGAAFLRKALVVQSKNTK